MGTNKRIGFTLVELLVVITIIGMLMAMLLPAVNQAVEAARNAQCKNHIAQLAKATTIFESQLQVYPGWNNVISNSSGTDPKVTWCIRLFPYIEQKGVYRKYSETSLRPTPYIEVFVCPSNPPDVTGGPTNGYVANAGQDTTNNELPSNGVFHNRTGAAAIRINADYVSGNDGLSNTLMFSENLQATMWNQNTGSYTKKATVFVWRSTTSPSTTERINGNKKTATKGLTPRPSSFHPGGVNVAFCDDHVIYLREDIHYRVYTQLMTSYGDDSNVPSAFKSYLLDAADYR